MGVSLNIRDIISKGVFMVAVFLIATAARGEWLLLIVYLAKDYLRETLRVADTKLNETLSERDFLTDIGLNNLPIFMVFAVGVSFSTFWGIGLSFDKYFYKNRKHIPKEWKCQPDRWLTKDTEWHEFFLGSFNMLVGSLISGVLSCYIVNGGTNTLYTSISDYGWLYFLATIPALFMYNEAVSYYPHRFFHNPYLYKKVHKIHHKYGSPTLYSTTAMHPLEFLMYQTFLAIPAFTVPLHVGVFLTILLYGYYYGMMDHSGINMDAVWPWQPSSVFHDNHHRYFHCNFGFNSLFFDKLHGTLRSKDRIYGETIFNDGRGRDRKESEQKQY